MALNLITLEEAAKIVGVTPDELNELRDRQEIYGYRDGSSWKFKRADVERFAEDRAARQDDAGEEVGDSDDLVDVPLDEDSAEMVLLSEVELGESNPSTSSTIIGKPGEQAPDESDIHIVTDDERAAGDASKSGVRLVADKSTPDSDVKLVSDSGVVPTEEDPPTIAEDEPSLELDLDDELPLLAEDDSGDISLDLDEDSEIPVPAATERPADPGSDIALDEESLELSLDDELGAMDEEFVLGDETGGAKTGAGSSDVTVNPSQSGISLADPADSGISLADPADSGISLVDDSADATLTLGEADEMFDLGDAPELSLADDSDSQEIGELKSEDDFLLTPMEDDLADDAESSGSQVIAIESDSEFGDDALGDASSADFGGAALLDDEGGFAEEDAGLAGPAGLAPAGAEAAMGAPVAAPREAPFSLANVLGLAACVLFLGISGMMSYDLMRNMWAWDTPYSINSSVMDLILGLVG